MKDLLTVISTPQEFSKSSKEFIKNVAMIYRVNNDMLLKYNDGNMWWWF